MPFIHSSSPEALPSSLDVFGGTPHQVGEEKSQLMEFRATASNLDASTITVDIQGVGHGYGDAALLYLYTKQKIVNGDGKDITDADGSDATVVNYPLGAMWSQIDCSMNGTVISQSSMTYGYRSYIETKLNYGRGAKETHLQQRMWYEDTAGFYDSLNSEQNLGLAWRRSRTKNSKVFELFGPLHINLCNSDRLILNNVTISLKATRSRDDFVIMSTKGTEKLKLLDFKVVMRRVTVSPSVMLAHAQVLEKAHAKYPLTRVDIKTITIAKGLRDKTVDNLFLNQMPQRVIIGFVDNKAFNGDYKLNPFNFHHFNLNFLQLHVDGMPVPAQPLTPDFSAGLYIEAYNTLFSATGIHWKDDGNHIPFADYPRGSTLFAFDLTPDLSASMPHWNLQRHGSLRLDMRFADALPDAINCVVYAEFQNLIEIDKDRNVIVDYNV
ncbi:uncharacterized protein F54H12.2-like [Frankliniella occidentalis]|uniref:Uncharacterized protein F54H12.2-like n=1 Tax=Frankliniella occidentalis TaxID=133901 RepID=A0A9C6X1P2_FRAOC|nr:uncharacterized protein F54H12.2-like [Frankliniella occidentalis]